MNAELGSARWLMMNELIETFAARGDLAHLALLLWATGASAVALFTLRELAFAMRRFDDFVRELALFNARAAARERSDHHKDGD